jgi:hypothetical protein
MVPRWLVFVVIAGTADAFRLATPNRRNVCLAAGAAALQTCIISPAVVEAKELKEAQVLRDTAAKLKAVLDGKDAFVAELTTGDAAVAMLPAAIPFTTFQKLEPVSDPEFMEAAIDYAEAFRAAKDLVKLAKLTRQPVEVTNKEKGKPRETTTMAYGDAPGSGLSSAKEYADRAVQEVLGASVALEAAIGYMGK